MRIYLDHNATTPLRDEVLESMHRVLRDCFGNPSSSHAEGAAARRELVTARERVASLLHVAPREVIFTGSATEANNSAIQGHLALAGGRRHLVTTCVEHPSVEEPMQVLEAMGAEVTRVPVDPEGRLDIAELAAALRPDTALLAVILANNETGVLQDVPAIAEAAAARGVPLHVDATQAVGKVPVDVPALGATTLSGTAHKLNGPKGAGFLIAHGPEALPPLVRGGPQERRRRGGTENLAGIVGLGVACELALRELPERARRYAALRDRLWEGILAKVPAVRRNGSAERVLPNTLNLEFVAAAGEVLLEALDGEGVAVSAGAACHSGSIEPSGVLLAMGRTPEQARSSLRLSVGLGVDEAQVDRVIALLAELVPRVRGIQA